MGALYQPLAAMAFTLLVAIGRILYIPLYLKGAKHRGPAALLTEIGLFGNAFLSIAFAIKIFIGHSL